MPTHKENKKEKVLVWVMETAQYNFAALQLEA